MLKCLDLSGRVAVVIGSTSGLGRAIAIGLDAASLEHEARGAIGARGFVTRQPRDALDRAPDLGVAGEVGILRPRVERPVHQVHAPRLVVDEGRRRVAQPDPIGGYEVKAYVLRDVVRAELFLALRTHRVVRTEDLDALVFGLVTIGAVPGGREKSATEKPGLRLV